MIIFLFGDFKQAADLRGKKSNVYRKPRKFVNFLANPVSPKTPCFGFCDADYYYFSVIECFDIVFIILHRPTSIVYSLKQTEKPQFS